MEYTYRWFILLGVILCHTVSATAAPVTADLTAYYVSSGDSGTVALDSGAAVPWFYETYGLSFQDAYLYSDGTDTGIANATQYGSSSGLVFFEDTTDYVMVDWMTVDAQAIYLDAYNAQGVLLDSFSYSGSAGSTGSVALNGEAIYALTFHDNGGTVGLTALSYDYDGLTDGINKDTPVPEPATMTLMAFGLFFASWRLKRMSRPKG